MQHLTPVGLSKDGKSLILVSNSGEEFAVPVDHRFRAALRGDHARLGQLEMKMESALRPRDIQARIRGGESAEDVAAAAQTTVDAIMGFAAPVLAERAHVAESAQKSSIRRKSTEASAAGRTLDQASRTHLTTVGVRFDEVEWDAWRRDDGRWALVARYSVGGSPRRAEFTYDHPGRYVVADNQEARLLTGEATPAPERGTPTRRLSSVPSSTPADDELPLADHELGDDAIELVRDQSPDDVVAEAALDDHGDADWIADVPEPRADTDPEAEVLDAEPTEPTEPPAPAEPPAAEARRPAKVHKKGRSSVPSWDEIMFGGGKGE
jgi:hypothetical protein